MLADINSFWYSIGHGLENMMESTLVPIMPAFNLAVICLGFFGLFYWMRKQVSYNKQASNDKNQLK